MRITLRIDSATADEARDFVLAFQATRNAGLPSQITTEPTIKMVGIGWEITTPALYGDHAEALMHHFQAKRENAPIDLSQRRTATA